MNFIKIKRKDIFWTWKDKDKTWKERKIDKVYKIKSMELRDLRRKLFVILIRNLFQAIFFVSESQSTYKNVERKIDHNIWNEYEFIWKSEIFKNKNKQKKRKIWKKRKKWRHEMNQWKLERVSLSGIFEKITTFFLNSENDRQKTIGIGMIRKGSKLFGTKTAWINFHINHNPLESTLIPYF